MYNKCTYTAETLKECIYKALGSYSRGGEEVSVMSGFAADTEKKYISVLNMCLRRVALNMPLCEKNTEVVFEGEKALLPSDCHKVKAVIDGESNRLNDGAFYVCDGYIVCRTAKDGASAKLIYTVMPEAFTEDTPADTPVNLPDISADALIYLTASELCPSEYGELWNKLIYKYRDISLNCYNVAEKTVRKNRFFGRHGRLFGNMG